MRINFFPLDKSETMSWVLDLHDLCRSTASLPAIRVFNISGIDFIGLISTWSVRHDMRIVYVMVVSV